MSRFVTKISVNVKPLLDILQKNAFVHSQTYDEKTQALTVLWESDSLPTGYTFPVEYPLADLLAKRLPRAVKDQKALKTPPKPENAPTSLTAPEKAIPASTPDHFWDAERLAKEKAAGPVEYMGVESSWKPVDAEHVWQPGFFYRTAPKPAPQSGVDTPLTVK